MAPPSPSPDRLLTTRKAAEIVGVSPWTLRRAAARGEIPALRIGRRGLWRFHPAALANLLDQARGDQIEGDPVTPSPARLGTASAAVEPEPARVPTEAA